MREKSSIMGVRNGQKTPSLGITLRHHSASLVTPNSDPLDGFKGLVGGMLDLIIFPAGT